MDADRVIQFAQISDLHLSNLSGLRKRSLLGKRLLGYLSWYKRKRHEHDGRLLAALKQDLNNSAIDQLLICGDLTHLGLPDEFRQVRDWLDTLDISAISIVPGNHDAYVAEPWASTCSQWAPYLRSIDRPLPSSAEEAFPSLNVRGNIAFIGLSSALPTAPFLATGQLGPGQLQRLNTLLHDTAAQGLFRVVYLHHPPFPGMEKWRKNLRDSRALADTIEQQGAELVLHGHRHRWQLQNYNDAGRPVPVVAAASASAQGIHGEVASYNHFRVSKSGDTWLVEVENRVYDTLKNCFVATEKHQLTIPQYPGL